MLFEGLCFPLATVLPRPSQHLQVSGSHSQPCTLASWSYPHVYGMRSEDFVTGRSVPEKTAGS